MSTQIVTNVPTTIATQASNVPVQPSPTRQERATQMAATVDAAFERLAEQLAAGHTQDYLSFLAFHSRFHRYSPANALLILSQCPDATRVAGLSTWNRLGYRVRAGERALWIWTPMIRKRVDPATGQEGETLVGFRPAPVFDASQLANLNEKPLPSYFTPLPGDVEQLYQQVRERIEAERIVVEERPLPMGVQGSPSAGPSSSGGASTPATASRSCSMNSPMSWHTAERRSGPSLWHCGSWKPRVRPTLLARRWV